MRREQIGEILNAAKDISNHTEFVVAGSLSVLGVVDTPPELMAQSVDVDFYTLTDPEKAFEIAYALGEDSMWRQRHGYYLDPISPDLPVLPTGWRERMVPIKMGDITVYFMEVNDIAVSKYARSLPNDFRWIEAGYNAGLLNIDTIRGRSEWGTDYPDEADRVKLRNGLALHSAAKDTEGNLNEALLTFIHGRQYDQIKEADDSDREYVGRIVYADKDHAVQFLGSGILVIHDGTNFPEVLALDLNCSIAYDEDGKTAVTHSGQEDNTPRPTI